MKRNIALFLLIMLGLNIGQIKAQEDTDKMTKVPSGTILTLKEDFIIKTFEGVIALEPDNKNFKVYNIVFDSKNKRRIMRKGTQFIVDEIEVVADFLKIHIKNKINWIYFGEVKNLKQLKIASLRKYFDIEFPIIEEF